MARELTEQEIEVVNKIYEELDGTSNAFDLLSEGFRAGLDYQQAQQADPLREAAPELLAACKAAIPLIERAWAALDHNYYETLASQLGDLEEQIRTAIAKVEPKGGYQGTECAGCGTRFDNTYPSWPNCPACGRHRDWTGKEPEGGE